MTDNDIILTDSEIIKALEVCSDGYCYMGGCPLADGSNDSIEKCTSELSKASLDLINRQKAEIERLTEEKDNLIRTYKECMVSAIREFAERLKLYLFIERGGISTVSGKDIDNLVKEITEDKP